MNLRNYWTILTGSFKLEKKKLNCQDQYTAKEKKQSRTNASKYATNGNENTGP